MRNNNRKETAKHCRKANVEGWPGEACKDEESFGGP